MIAVCVQTIDETPCCDRGSIPVFSLQRVTCQNIGPDGVPVGGTFDVLVFNDGVCYCYDCIDVEFSGIDDAFESWSAGDLWSVLGGVDWHDCHCVAGRAFACEYPRSEYLWQVELGQMVAAYGNEMAASDTGLMVALYEARRAAYLAWRSRLYSDKVLSVSRVEFLEHSGDETLVSLRCEDLPLDLVVLVTDSGYFTAKDWQSSQPVSLRDMSCNFDCVQVGMSEGLPVHLIDCFVERVGFMVNQIPDADWHNFRGFSLSVESLRSIAVS